MVDKKNVGHPQKGQSYRGQFKSVLQRVEKNSNVLSNLNQLDQDLMRTAYDLVKMPYLLPAEVQAEVKAAVAASSSG